MTKQINLITIILFVCACLCGCAKPLVQFKALNEQELIIGIDVEGSSSEDLKSAVEELYFVKVVQGDSVDRIVKGVANEPKFNLTFANNDGSSIIGIQAETVSQCIEKLQPALMNTYVLKTMLRARSRNQPFKIEVNTDKGADDTYRASEYIQFQVKSEKACYLILVEMAASGKINILFPNSHSPSQQIEAGKSYNIPAENSEFKIGIDPYQGQAIIWAVGSEDKPLDLEDMTGYKIEDVEGYITLSHQESADFIRKLFPIIWPAKAVVVGKPWATSYTVYKVD